MNNNMFDSAMGLIDSMSNDDISDALVVAGIAHDCVLPTRYLCFVGSGIPSSMSGIIHPILNAQLGSHWVEIHREWKAIPNGKKQMLTVMVVAVESEEAEVLIRLSLPCEIRLTSSDYYKKDEIVA